MQPHVGVGNITGRNEDEEVEGGDQEEGEGLLRIWDEELLVKVVPTGRHNRFSRLSVASVVVLNEIGSTVWNREEHQSYNQAYTKTPGPTSAYVT